MLSRIQRVTRFGVSCAVWPIRFALTPFEESIQTWGAKETKKVLNEYGLKYHDILIETPDVLSAIARLSPAEKENLDRRVYRAFDISLKQKPMPKEMQDKAPTLDSSDFYLEEHMDDIVSEKNEREKLNWY